MSTFGDIMTSPVILWQLLCFPGGGNFLLLMTSFCKFYKSFNEEACLNGTSVFQKRKAGIPIPPDFSFV
jgi:hypothetical protein